MKKILQILKYSWVFCGIFVCFGSRVLGGNGDNAMLGSKEDKIIKNQFLEQLEELKTLNLPEDQYIIWGSGVLAIRGIREASDVDIIVSKNCWNNLIKKYPVQGSKLNLLKIGNIEIWKDCMNLTDKVDQMIIDKDIIEGYPFMKLEYTIEWKTFLNREKDKKDILLLEKILKNSGLK